MITAEEFSRKYTRLRSAMAISDISEMMIEFTKLHVEAALKEASKKAEICETWGNNDYESDDPVGYYTHHVDGSSILNSYPLDNIK